MVRIIIDESNSVGGVIAEGAEWAEWAVAAEEAG